MDQIENQEPKKSFFEGFASFILLVWDFLKIVIVAVIIIVPVRYFIFQPFVVSGYSMQPNYQTGQYLIIDELSYRFTAPVRGQVVVLKYPVDPKQFFIKRIIGLPGETIQIDNGKVKIFNQAHPEGEVLSESYLPNDNLTYPHDALIIGGQKTITLKADEYFALGDNRLASSDSRNWGILPRADIVGKVLIRVLPLTEFTFHIKTPSYGF